MTSDLAPKEPTINLAIGPNCPVRCAGCYNHFGNTEKLGGLITADQILDFASDAEGVGVTQATLSGGDPLFHPEIVQIASGLKDLGMKVKLDTVGTAFIGDARVVFKGRGVVPKVNISDLAPHVDFVSIPLDGASNETIGQFRRGRPNLFEETGIIAGILQDAGVIFGINTVANTANIGELEEVKAIAEAVGASEWQIFEYDPTGPNISRSRDSLKLSPGEFEAGTDKLTSGTGNLKIVSKDLERRSGSYFLVDDSGHAWKPIGDGLRRVFGHITTDRRQVIDALVKHIEA